MGSPWLSYSMPGHYIKTEQGDIDAGQHFNNFRVNPEDHPYLGVCFVHTSNVSGVVEKETLMHFKVCLFVTKCVPYLCTQAEGRIIEEIKGNPADDKG